MTSRRLLQWTGQCESQYCRQYRAQAAALCQLPGKPVCHDTQLPEGDRMATIPDCLLALLQPWATPGTEAHDAARRIQTYASADHRHARMHARALIAHRRSSLVRKGRV
jgi:hypothetical protein